MAAKRTRLETAGARPTLLDIFSGCGGLSLGFDRAGFRSLGGIDNDPQAAASYAHNLHPEAAAIHTTALDITAPETSPRAILKRWGHDDDWERAVDVVVGGPPCPTYTRIGRAKLRHLRDDPQAFRNDARASLYLPYLAFVERLAPVAVVMENVPDILNFGGNNLGEAIADALGNMGYVSRYTLLNAANFGVPQFRDRFFLFAIHESIGHVPFFPVPSHHAEVPRGYESSRNVALKLIDRPESSSPPRTDRWSRTPAPSASAPAAVTARDALRDLPILDDHLRGEDLGGARRFDTVRAYRAIRDLSAFAVEMRAWPGFESSGKISDHVTRCLTDRDYRIFERMRPGDEYPRAVRLGEALLEEYFVETYADADRPRVGSSQYKRERADFVPPYDPSKFPNKWRKLEAHAPSRTLTAHLGKDTYSHIHFDKQQARTITVREAARLQSFPDGFRFAGTMNPAFRQIGNSVPPLLAFRLASALKANLGLNVPDRTATSADSAQRAGEKKPSSGTS